VTNARRRAFVAALAAGLLAADAPAPDVPATFVSPAEQSIAAAQRAIAKDPKAAKAHVELAIAHARRARETSDTAHYDAAMKAATRAAELAPGDIEAEKARVWILLGRHEFAAARDAARALQKRFPDDVLIYGFLTDANAELGDYAEAEKAAQWMLDLRPGNVPGLTRAAYLRELFGDFDGALDLMQQSYDRIPPSEVEDRAWVLAQTAHLLLLQGRADDAGRAAERSLELFPDYHYALAELARVRTAQGRHDDAVALLRRRWERAPHPENLYELAVALERAGRTDAARERFAAFETAAVAESEKADNCNRELVLYYVDHARDPAKALAVAERERKRRADVMTRDAYAWALHHRGRSAEARAEIQAVLDVGVRDPVVLAHAEAIERGAPAPVAATPAP
jgi:tetratricopeptide (TPR) repeat protein